MVGLLTMGTLIPIASDGRFGDLTPETPWVAATFALSWLIWGCGAWGVAVSLAPKRLLMLGSSITCWAAAYAASTALVGAHL